MKLRLSNVAMYIDGGQRQQLRDVLLGIISIRMCPHCVKVVTHNLKVSHSRHVCNF
jgi:hypothetical protein